MTYRELLFEVENPEEKGRKLYAKANNFLVAMLCALLLFTIFFPFDWGMAKMYKQAIIILVFLFTGLSLLYSINQIWEKLDFKIYVHGGYLTKLTLEEATIEKLKSRNQLENCREKALMRIPEVQEIQKTSLKKILATFSILFAFAFAFRYFLF